MTLRYTVVFDREEDGRWIGSVPGMPGCHVYGRTRRQVLERARRAASFYIESLRLQGRKPPVQPAVTAEIEITV
jgi:predicted RNase H-like HicB family nuclease